MNETNSKLELARDFVEFTGMHVFLTGKAGTGKTTFLKNLKGSTHKRMVVVAPTGVAAINAGGVTIHSFFQLPFGPMVPGYQHGQANNEQEAQYRRFNKEKIRIIRSLDLLVIDEISMVRADMMDGIDETLRRFRRNDEPFGGVQLLMIGDLQQLTPVVRDNEWSILRAHYDTAFFFSSKALQRTHYVSIELLHVFRQQDDFFIDILNKVRNNLLDKNSIDVLNNRVHNGRIDNDEGYITLTTHNAKAQNINDARLSRIMTPSRSFLATIEGNYPEYSFPTDPELVLKEGAQVMFVKNDPSPEKKFFNGKIGKITSMEEDAVIVQCPDDEDNILVYPLEWQNIKYSIDSQTKEIKEEIEGTFTQIPLKLAWAITVHKSQGLTFDRAIIDVEAAFAFGQVYVALSRCRTLEGMILSSPVSTGAIKTNSTISNFNQDIEKNQPDQSKLETARQEFRKKLILDLFDFSKQGPALWSLMKILKEYPAAAKFINFPDMRETSGSLEKELNQIATRFHQQLKIIFAGPDFNEYEELLQDRIKKACRYFSEKLNSIIIKPFSELNIDTDNKQAKKAVQHGLERLLEEAYFKDKCLRACFEGFKTEDYLKVRALAAMEEFRLSGRKRKPVFDKEEISNKNLYQTIKNWRDLKAEELNLPVFMILQLKSIHEIADTLPASEKELSMIRGLGKKKLQQFGPEILELVKDHIRDNIPEK